MSPKLNCAKSTTRQQLLSKTPLPLDMTLVLSDSKLNPATNPIIKKSVTMFWLIASGFGYENWLKKIMFELKDCPTKERIAMQVDAINNKSKFSLCFLFKAKPKDKENITAEASPRFL